MQGKRVFGDGLLLYAKYADAKGLIRGNSVMINGFTVGQVMELELEGDSILVTMELKKNRPIPTDSRALIFTKDLLGAMAIRIERGSSSQLMTDESYIQGGEELGMMSKATNLLETEGKDLLDNLT